MTARIRIQTLCAVAALAVTGLSASFTAHANPEAAAKPDPAKGKPIAEAVCGACHGTDGNSLAAANPNLAGQIPEYIVKQLSNFKPGADGQRFQQREGLPPRHHPAVIAGSFQPEGAGAALRGPPGLPLTVIFNSIVPCAALILLPRGAVFPTLGLW